MPEPFGYDGSHTWIRSRDASGAETPQPIEGFQIEKKLGQGGMASVFLATDLKSQRKVALKIIHPHLASNADFLQRFINEAKATEALRHEHIVETTGHGTDKGRYYMACEFVEGGTVHELSGAMGNFPTQLALDLIAQLLEALAHAHSRGVIHRDVKPENMLLTRSGCLKVGDFGIAKTVGGVTLTQTGMLIGTPAYMSPEQALGQPVDARSDLYSAGVVLYELIGGANPRHSENPTTSLAKVLNEELPPIGEAVPGTTAFVQELMDGLLARDPSTRFASAEVALSKLQPIVEEIRRSHPQMVAQCLTSPPLMKQRLLAEQAAIWHQRALQFLKEGPVRKEPAALCAFYAVSLDPANQAFQKLFEEICAKQGHHFGPSKNPKILELEKLLAGGPQSPGVLQQLAQLYRLEGNVYRASLFLRRYLSVRPKDGYASTQLTQLTGESHFQRVPMGPTTRQLGEGIKTGGLQARAKPAEAEIAEASTPRPVHPSRSSRARSMENAPPAELWAVLSGLWNAVGRKLLFAAAMVGLVVFAIKRAGRFVDSSTQQATQASDSISRAKDQEENARIHAQGERELERKSDANAQQAARLLNLAMEAFNKSDFTGAIKGFDDLIQQHPKRAEAAKAKFLRAKALLAVGSISEAIAAFSEFIERHAANAEYWEAILRRGQAYHQKLDDTSALSDLNDLLTRQPTSPWAPEALVTRGEIQVARGNNADAAADFRAVLAQTGPSNALNGRASIALKKLDPDARR